MKSIERRDSVYEVYEMITRDAGRLNHLEIPRRIGRRVYNCKVLCSMSSTPSYAAPIFVHAF